MMQKKEILKELKRLEIFDDLTDDDLKLLVMNVKVMEPSPGDYLIHEGREGERIYFIYSGTCDVFKRIGERRVKIATLKEGDFFGEIALLLNCPATATVQAKERCKLWYVPKMKFLQFLDRYKSVFFRIFTISSERITSSNIFQLRHLLDELEFFYKRFLDVQRIWQFLPTDLVKSALTGDLSLSQTGKRINSTVFFLDLRHYTLFAEENPPEQVITAVNYLFGEFTKIITKRRGNVDKYLGDGLMANFHGEKKPYKNALNAIHAALEVMDALRTINIRRSHRIEEEFYLGIGLNSGESILGNVGVPDLMLNYTLIGDTVNVASRIASYDRNNTILITEETYRLIKDHIAKDSIVISDTRKIELRGKLKPVHIRTITQEMPVN